jgi:UDP-glucose 4-epimerase
MNTIFGQKVPIQFIGTRHGEKLYETLLSREERARAVDLGRYFKIPSDTRDLNYAKFLENGEPSIQTFDDYTSHNTTRLTQSEVQELLQSLDIVAAQLNQ